MKIPKPFMCMVCETHLPLRPPTTLGQTGAWQCRMCGEVYWMAEVAPDASPALVERITPYAPTQEPLETMPG